MNRELFGVFGPRARFDAVASPGRFDRVLAGDAVTVGVRADRFGLDARTAIHRGPEGLAVLWGQVYGDGRGDEPARHLLERYAEVGRGAFSELNGSYLALVEHDGQPVVATDVLRTRECFYTDAGDDRVFGTDPASVASAIPSPDVDPSGVLQFLYLGVVVGERTVLDRLRRLRTDAVLTATGHEPLARLVYDPQEFDHAAALADRLERAVDRRVTDRAPTGLLLSGGFDSRTILALHPDVDATYTVGSEGGDESRVARELASDHGVAHERLPPGERYLVPTAREVEASQGLRETLHIHHSGHVEAMAVEEMFHGMLFDSLFRDHFVPGASIDVAGHTFPLPWLADDLDPVPALKDGLGCVTPGVDLVADCDAVAEDDHDALLQNVFERELDRCFDRCDGIHNAVTQLGIRARPTRPFRTHLADRFLERFVAADAELVDWHLTTPPEHRTAGTFRRALEHLDDDLLTPRPPDRPHDSLQANEVEGFVRRTVPFLDAFGSPLPDRRRLYGRHDLDRKLLGDVPALHDAPVQFKLRVNDVRSWLAHLRADSAPRADTDVGELLPG